MALQSTSRKAPDPSYPVLVVDDNDDIRELVRDFLEEEGFSVATASSGVEALECLERGLCPGLILLDLMMPKMSGWEVLERLRGNASHATIPVAVMSGSPRERLPRSTYFIPKPFQLDDLVELVKAHCYPVAA